MNALALGEVERQIADGYPTLRFSRKIERLFCAAYMAERIRLVVIWAVLGLMVYNLIYFIDHAMLPDQSTKTLLIRAGVFTPFVIVCLSAVCRWPDARLYDMLCLLVAAVGIMLPMAFVATSSSPYLLVYQTYNSAVFLFFAIALRPRFRTVLAGLAIMVAAHGVAVHQMVTFDAITYTGIVVFYLTLSLFLAVGAYFLERGDRQNFLNELRATLLEAELRRHAEGDELSGLLNRRALARHAEAIWNGAADTSNVSAILLDIDHFKRFNDVHGHLQGDECIRSVATSIRQTVDAGALVFRFGGEEILVLCTGRDETSIMAMAQSIRTDIEALAIRHEGCEGRNVTASLGVAQANPATTPLETLLQKADCALYEAKRRGRNTAVLAP